MEFTIAKAHAGHGPSTEQKAQRQRNTQRERQSGQKIEYPVDGLIGHNGILCPITDFCKAFLTLRGLVASAFFKSPILRETGDVSKNNTAVVLSWDNRQS
jgi:hypothetical protein